MFWWMWLIGPDGGNPVLFRGGFLLCAVATLMMVAAVTHERAFTSKALSIPVLLWIGTRSYGLYLYHWPIYQIIRNIAGIHLKFHEFVFAMIAHGDHHRTLLSLHRDTDPKGHLRGVPRAHPPVAGRRPTQRVVRHRRRRRRPHALRRGEPGDGARRGERSAPDARRGRRVHLRCRQRSDLFGWRATPTDPPVVTDDSTAPADSTDPSGSAVPPPAVVETTTTTTRPPVPIAQFALGDSVMLGAAGELNNDGFTVDAAESRQFSDGRAIVEQLRDDGRLGEVVVVHLGTNGNINAGRSHRDDGRAGRRAAGAAPDDRRRP